MTLSPGAGNRPPESGSNAGRDVPGTAPAGASGIVLLDKESGYTSFQALSVIKRKLGTRHVGHAGTLDRFAEGLLIVLAGRCTRLVPLIQGLDKEYLARIRFGIETDTLDPEGTVVAEAPVPDEASLRASLPVLTGEIRQTPPVFSALHVQGTRASKLARRGVVPDLAPRTVWIHRIEMIDYAPPELAIRISCSKGTYIRSLARDLALQCGSRAHVTYLRRLAIGPFRVEDAVKERDFEPSKDLLSPSILRKAGGPASYLTARQEFVPLIRQGVPLREEFLQEKAERDGSYGLFSQDGDLLALLEKGGGGYRYGAVFSDGRS